MENIGGGELGMMCCELTEAENVQHIFSIFFSEELHKSVSQKLMWGLYQWEDLCWKSLHYAIFFVGCDDYPKSLL